MLKNRFIYFLLLGIIIMSQSFSQEKKAFRPPAVPLVACDPYFSIWSTSDNLYSERTKHWTGANNGMLGLVKVDGKCFRILGLELSNIPGLPQKSVKVFPTRTIYEFEGEGINVTLTFLTPAIPYEINLLSRPVTYIVWDVKSIDSKEHEIQIYYDNTAETVVNRAEQKVAWSRLKLKNIIALRFGTAEQPILDKKGDDLRIDWGYQYLIYPKSNEAESIITSFYESRKSFAETGKLPHEDDLRNPRPASDEWPVMAYSYDFGKVTAVKSNYILLAYDDLFSIQYLYRNLKPYWKKELEIKELISKSLDEFTAIQEKCKKFDDDIMSALEKVGGKDYALISSLAFRQCLAANKIAVDIDGTALMFPKENFSNGCISTVDVIYPASPFFLLFNPQLLKAQLTPLLEYSKSGKWKFPFAPHDLGTYPLANGQVYGGGEKTEENQMPVEESGNMLIMLAAIAKIDGNADYSTKYWDIISKWADYLKEKGLDPENQLCTDDFAGHLAHNVNLSLKAILAIDSYSMLCKLAGKKEDSKKYHALAKEYAEKWIKMADDGDHYRLAFDKPNTWSQKYNLVWDKILGFNLFPDEIANKETKYYLTKMNKFGLPLDNRKEYTKLDWTVWTATLANNNSDFEKIIAPIVDFLNTTPDRVPMNDWYWTNNAHKVGFQARSVVGGVFIKMLADEKLWKEWAGKK
jgi:hypothetical protein